MAGKQTEWAMRRGSFLYMKERPRASGALPPSAAGLPTPCAAVPARPAAHKVHTAAHSPVHGQRGGGQRVIVLGAIQVKHLRHQLMKLGIRSSVYSDTQSMQLSLSQQGENDVALGISCSGKT